MLMLPDEGPGRVWKGERVEKGAMRADEGHWDTAPRDVASLTDPFVCSPEGKTHSFL